MAEIMKARKIIFCSSAAEVEECRLLRDRGEMGRAIVIATNPHARSRAAKIGITAVDTTRYFTTDSHKRILELSKELTGWLRREAKFEGRNKGIEHAYEDVFILIARTVLNYCARAIEIASNAIDLHQPDVVTVSRSGRRGSGSPYVEPEEKYFGELVCRLALQRGIRCEDMSDAVAIPFLAGRDFMGNGRIIARYALKYIRFYMWQIVLATRRVTMGERPIFCTTKFYQMKAFSRELQERSPNYRVRFFPNAAIPAFSIPNSFMRIFWPGVFSDAICQKKAFADLRTEMKKEEKLFAYRGIRFGDILSRKIQGGIARHIVGLVLWADALDKALDRTSPKAVISNGNRQDDLMLAELCRKKGIMSILISHGSHRKPKGEHELIEWGEHGMALLRGPFSCLALQSPLAEEYLEMFPVAGSVIKTGPLIWGRPLDFRKGAAVFRKLCGEKVDLDRTRVIVHAGTPKPDSTSRLYIYETQDEYLKAICELASVVESMDDAIMIIKFRPQYELGIEDMKRLLPLSDKVVLSVEESFIDVLSIANLLVSFSSTTVEEALQNKIPVLLYGGDGRYKHVPAHRITEGCEVGPSAVYHVERSQDLGYALTKIFDLDVKEDCALFTSFIYNKSERVSIESILLGSK